MGQASGIGVLILTVNAMDASQFASLTTILLVGSFVVPALSFGVADSALVASSGVTDEGRRRQLIGSGNTAILTATLISTTAFLVTMRWTLPDASAPTLCAAASLMALSSLQSIPGLSEQSRQQFRWVGAALALPPAATLALTAAAIARMGAIELEVALIVRLAPLALLLVVRAAQMPTQDRVLAKSKLKETLATGLKFHATTILGMASTRLDQLLAIVWLTPAQMALYGTSYQFSNQTRALGMTVSLPAVPHIASQECPRCQHSAARRSFRQSVSTIALLTLLAAGASFLLSRSFLTSYGNAAPFLAVLAVLAGGIAAIAEAETRFLKASYLVRPAVAGRLGGVLVGFLSAWSLRDTLGVAGLLVGSIIGSIAFFSIQRLASRHAWTRKVEQGQELAKDCTTHE